MRNLRFDRTRLMHLSAMGVTYFPPSISLIPTKESVEKEVEKKKEEDRED